MPKFPLIILTVLLGVVLAGFASAGMMDDLMKKSEEASQTVNEANAEVQKAGETLDAGQQQAIEAQGATTQGSGDVTHQLKEAAKEETNKAIDSQDVTHQLKEATKGETNKAIDNLGK